MKLVLSSLALLTTASSVANADDAPPPPAYVELTVGASRLIRFLDNGDDVGLDEVTSVGVRGGYFPSPTAWFAFELSLGYSRYTPRPDEGSPGGDIAAHRERALVGIRLASRRGPIGGFLRLGVGLERAALRVEASHDSDFGAAAELGGGALVRFHRIDLGAEVTLGTQSHDGERLYIEHELYDEYYSHSYVGIEAGLQVFAGYRF